MGEYRPNGVSNGLRRGKESETAVSLSEVTVDDSDSLAGNDQDGVSLNNKPYWQGCEILKESWLKIASDGVGKITEMIIE